MEKVGQIIHVLSNNFELIMALNIAALIIFLILFIALKLSEPEVRAQLPRIFRNTLLLIIIVGQIFILLGGGYLFYVNYHNPKPKIDFPGDILSGTDWIEDKITLYYIDKNELRSISINGKKNGLIFQADEEIRDYHFSPNGKYLLIATSQSIVLLERKTGKHKLIDAVSQGQSQEATKGSVSGIRWAPTSDKFVYEIARWSKFSSQDNVYVYYLDTQKKKAINSPARRISSLYWDEAAQNLYYLHYEAQDPSVYVYAYEVKVFKVPLTSFKPEFVSSISYEDSNVPIENLDLRDIQLHLASEKYSFSRYEEKEFLHSKEGPYLGIDKKDFLFYVKNKWFRNRLFKVEREPNESTPQRYQYKGGDHTISDMRWIPGARYVIMKDKHHGVLILDPEKAIIGRLAPGGNVFGWMEDEIVYKE